MVRGVVFTEVVTVLWSDATGMDFRVLVGCCFVGVAWFAVGCQNNAKTATKISGRNELNGGFGIFCFIAG